MVRARCPPGRSRAAPNRFTRSSPFLHSRKRRPRSTRGASETSPCRRAGDAKRRARPPKGDGDRKATRRGNRDPRAVGATSRYRVGSVRRHSVVGPHRVGDGSRRLVLIRSPARGPIQSRRGRACAAARPKRSWPQTRSRLAVAVDAPVRRAAPRAGPVGDVARSMHQGPFMSFLFEEGFGFWAVTAPGTASRRRGPACATGGTPLGPAWLPGSTGPCACRASSPVVASTPWPPATLVTSGRPPR